MTERERSTPRTRRAKRMGREEVKAEAEMTEEQLREQVLKAAQEQGPLDFDFLKRRRAARKRGRKRG